MAGTAEGARIRVLLVDDHGVVRRGLRGYLELLDDIEVIGEAENGVRGVELSAELVPDVVLMDIVMPQLDGIGAIAQIKAAQPGVHLDPAAARILAKGMRHRVEQTPVDPLTERELEVLSLVGHGRSNKEIATDLGITERTARTHVSNILGKLDLQSRTQAALYAVERKLVHD